MHFAQASWRARARVCCNVPDGGGVEGFGGVFEPSPLRWLVGLLLVLLGGPPGTRPPGIGGGGGLVTRFPFSFSLKSCVTPVTAEPPGERSGMPPGIGGGGGAFPAPVLRLASIAPGNKLLPPGVPIGVFGVPIGVPSNLPGIRPAPPGVPSGVKPPPTPRGDLLLLMLIGGTPGGPPGGPMLGMPCGPGGGEAPTGRLWPLAARKAGMPVGLLLFPVSAGRNDGRAIGGLAGGGGGGVLFGGFLGGCRGTAGFRGGGGRPLRPISSFLRMRLFRKSPPTKRRRISNFLSSTMVVTAARITSRISTATTNPVVTP